MTIKQNLVTPVEAATRRRQIRNRLIGLAILIALVLWAFNRYAPNRPVAYRDTGGQFNLDHFKYGSIGSDIENGIPVRVLQVLPRLFPEYLPAGGPQDYTAFGFIQEPGHTLPIGFSTRRRAIDLTGLNCAVCHVGQVRADVDAEPVTILGMPANTVDLQAFFNFLFVAAGDNRFTADVLIPEMEKDGRLFFIDRWIYRYLAIPQLQAGLLKRKAQLEAFMLPMHPLFGPGRVDTFNPYKTNQYAAYFPPGSFTDEERIGTADFPAIWNQGPREGMQLHWDGNNDSIRARNFSASFGAGATREHVDEAAIQRIVTWLIELAPPSYPYAITDEQSVLAHGAEIYRQYCYACHDFEGELVGQVDPIEAIRTDPHRLNSYTDKLVEAQHTYGQYYDFDHFRKTNGYANAPLDGIWARAPYLHNGSVPTLWDLLTPEAERNGGQAFFYRGHGVYDAANVGIRTDITAVDGRKSFKFIISEPGNSNVGHSGAAYGTELSDEDKRDLIEYLKTF